jgi:hypothetical protein
MRHLASQGIFTGGKRPFGFDIVLDAEVVRLAPNVAEMGPIPGSFLENGVNLIEYPIACQ